LLLQLNPVRETGRKKGDKQQEIVKRDKNIEDDEGKGGLLVSLVWFSGVGLVYITLALQRHSKFKQCAHWSH
jgi:hypothetical protein